MDNAAAWTVPEHLEASALVLGVELSSAQLGQFNQFAQLLSRWNQKFNLLSRRDIGRLWERHILDSLTVAPLLSSGRTLDAGCGAGFPGLPLAIADPQQLIVLLDRNTRKVRFVELVVSTLKLANASAVCSELGELPAPGRGYDNVTSRAVSQPAALWRAARHLLTDHGQMILMSGVGSSAESGAALPADEPAKSLVAELAVCGGAIAAVHNISIPMLEQSHQVMIIRQSDSSGGVD